VSGDGWMYVELELSADERRLLSYTARTESQKQDDFRYWHADPVERSRLKQRWWDIAEAYWPTEAAP
jgi:hypothetical protein